MSSHIPSGKGRAKSPNSSRRRLHKWNASTTLSQEPKRPLNSLDFKSKVLGCTVGLQELLFQEEVNPVGSRKSGNHAYKYLEYLQSFSNISALGPMFAKVLKTICARLEKEIFLESFQDPNLLENHNFNQSNGNSKFDGNSNMFDGLSNMSENKEASYKEGSYVRMTKMTNREYVIGQLQEIKILRRQRDELRESIEQLEKGNADLCSSVSSITRETKELDFMKNDKEEELMINERILGPRLEVLKKIEEKYLDVQEDVAIETSKLKQVQEQVVYRRELVKELECQMAEKSIEKKTKKKKQAVNKKKFFHQDNSKKQVISVVESQVEKASEQLRVVEKENGRLLQEHLKLLQVQTSLKNQMKQCDEKMKRLKTHEDLISRSKTPRPHWKDFRSECPELLDSYFVPIRDEDDG